MKAFIIEQKITMMANQYRIFTADDTGTKQEQIGFVHQKRLAFRERFDFFTDESRTTVLFKVQARSVIDVGARYDVIDDQDKVLGTIGKAFKASLLRSTWNVFASDDDQTPLVVARERSTALAIFRRVWEVLPYLGDLPFFLKYHFDFKKPSDETVLATYEKTTTFRDHYLLRIQDPLEKEIDWRTLVALGVMMDAMQSR
jgi:uncharacterized protein YxjI